jgi:CheY-like chemotaxis protein
VGRCRLYLPGVAGRRILVVDDDADGREAMRTLLELWGHTVAEAGNGESAIEIAVSMQPEVILLDLAMPTVDGFEVARRIRAGAGGERPFMIALTGYGTGDDVDQARAAGCDAHVLKPCDPDELRRLVQSERGDDAGGS